MNIRGFMNLVEGMYHTYDEWTLEDVQFLYHGTSSKHRVSIQRSGFLGQSHWGSESVARYFAKRECSTSGGSSIIFRVPLARFDQAKFAIDEEIVEFPIFDDYDSRQYEWECIEEEGRQQTWIDCLRLYEAVVYNGNMPVTADDLCVGKRK